MPRRTSSPTMMIVQFFMSAPLAEAQQALDTARAILSARAAGGLQQPSLPATSPAVPRARRGRKAKQAALPETTAGTTTGMTAAPGPVAVPDPKPRRRRGPGRPPVAPLTEASVATGPEQAQSGAPLPPVPSGVDLSTLPPPTE